MSDAHSVQQKTTSAEDSEWQVIPLGEATENFDSMRVPVKGLDRKPGPFPYFGASGIIDHVDSYIFDGDYLLVAEDGENLRTRKTPIAFMAQGKFWANNHVHIIRGNHLANTRYLCYLLSVTDISGYLTGSTQPKLSQANLNRILVRLPSIETQQWVVSMLDSLSYKIELNRRMNRTLEAIARAIFKSWFVDFDPVHAKAEGREPVGMNSETCALFPDSFQDSPLGKIPKGWEVTTLDKVADVVDCLHSKKPAPRDSGQLLLQVYNVGRNGELDLSQPFWINEDEYREWTRRIELGSGDLVITKTGRVGAVAQIPFGVKAGLGRNMVGIRSRPSISTPRFMRCLLTSDWMQREIDRMTSDGTILRSLHVKAIEKLRLALPPYRLLKRFEDVCHPVLCLAETNTAEVAELAQTRDALLPRLLSGRLPVGAIGYAGTDD